MSCRPIAHGPFIDESEFQTRLGVQRTTVVRILETWPDVDDSADTSEACLAVRAGQFGVDHPAVFEALEPAIETAYTLLRAHPPRTWHGLAAEEAFRAAIPRYEDREGVIDVTGDGVLGNPGDVLLRAFLPFRFWPLGGWAAYGAWHRDSDDGWTPLSEEELADVW